jgi:hypothetical protein
MESSADAQVHRKEYLKGLRFYLDFFVKYDHRPRARESLPPFLEKLSAKGQTAEQPGGIGSMNRFGRISIFKDPLVFNFRLFTGG